MLRTTVVVIGGGATGLGLLRDLSLRGVSAILVEQGDLAHGTSSRFHGLLHSGARYAVEDPTAAAACIAENAILRRIAPACVEDTGGLFVALRDDAPAFEARWREGCRRAGIPAEPVELAEAARLEPNLTRSARSVYRVPDGAIDGFRLVWQNADSARLHGGALLTYTQLTGFEQAGGRVRGITVRDRRNGQVQSIGCQLVVNAAGSWVGEVARLAGLEVPVKPDRGTLVAFNHRFTSRVVNRLRPPSDADIFVPHGSITMLGTTSVPTSDPADTTPTTAEILHLLRAGEGLFEHLSRYRILRAFSGTRPLISSGHGRKASRGFTVIDHAPEGLDGLVTVAGGKLTTYRLMAQCVADLVCRKLGLSARCRTDQEALVEPPPRRLVRQARRVFPAYSAAAALDRLGPRLPRVLERMRADPQARQLVCECELVTRAEVAEIAAAETTRSLDDLRRRTRLGMGTCQGAVCALRGAGALLDREPPDARPPLDLVREFLQARWRGIRPALWGKQLREAEFMRGIYQATLNLDGGIQP